MTSKEALNELKELIRHEHLENVIDTEKYYGIIEKDLKVLETFKKAYYRKELKAEDKPHYTYLQITFKEDEYNLLKEWLEEDLDKLDKITKILTDLIQYDKDGWLDGENIGPYLCKIEEWLENDK